MKRAALELAVIAACVLAGVGLGYGQITAWHMTMTVYMVLVFAVGAVALFVGSRIERRYPVKDSSPEDAWNVPGAKTYEERARGVDS